MIKTLKNKVLIISVFILLVCVGVLVNYTFFKPTKLNYFVASKIYKAPANSAFTDDNFYKCVVDAYNSKNKTSLEYTTSLNDEQLQTITDLDCYRKNITNISGLEKMPNLETLELEYNQLTSVKISSSNSKLKKLSLLENPITSIDVSGATSLTHLNTRFNQLTSIDVSKNTMLEELKVEYNSLTSLDVSKNVNLTKLHAYGNKLTSINVKGASALEEIMIQSNKLTSIDLSANPALNFLEIYSNQLTSLNVSSNPKLEELNAYSNKLTSINLAGATALKELSISSNQLTNIDLSKNTSLETVNLSLNKLTSLNITNNVNLKELVLGNTSLINGSYNRLTSIDVSKNVNLETLNLCDNKISSLDVSKNTKLKTLNVTANSLTSINVKNNPSLQWLSAKDNKLKSVDVSNNPLLQVLEVNNAYTVSGDNNLTSIDVTNNPLLYTLNISSNSITSLDVSKNPELENLYADNNKLTSLDLSNNTKLSTLRIGGNNFSDELYLYKASQVKVTGGVKIPDSVNWDSYEWSNSNSSIVSIDNGIATGLKSGTATLTTTNNYEATSKINVVEISSDKYVINHNANSIYIGDDTDLNMVKNHFSVSNSNITINILDNSRVLQVKYKNQILKEFTLINATSSKYDLSKNYIYVGINEFNFNSISVINGNSVVEDNKLLIKNEDEVVKSFDIYNINFGELDIKNKKIVVFKEMTYEQLISNINTNGATYEIYNDEEEVTVGNITSNMILKVYIDDEPVDTYQIIDEYLQINEKLIVDENSGMIENLTVGQTVQEIISNIETTGTVKLVNQENTEVIDDVLGTGYRVIIELSNEIVEYTLVVKGDITGDGDIKMSDVMKAATQILNNNTITGDCYLKAADVTGDGNIKMSDVMKLANYVIERGEL